MAGQEGAPVELEGLLVAGVESDQQLARVAGDPGDDPVAILLRHPLAQLTEAPEGRRESISRVARIAEEQLRGFGRVKSLPSRRKPPRVTSCTAAL